MTRAAPQKSHSMMSVPKPKHGARLAASHDPLEQEADRAAERALALPENARAEHVQRVQPATSANSHVDVFPASVKHTLGGSGVPLDPGLRADMERRFGHDFSKVRVHADRSAAESTLDVDAQAYTVGHHVVFGAGNFSPNSHTGRHLIAHELAHVIQQSTQSGSSQVLQRKPDPKLENGPSEISVDDLTGLQPVVDTPVDAPTAAAVPVTGPAVSPSPTRKQTSAPTPKPPAAVAPASAAQTPQPSGDAPAPTAAPPGKAEQGEASMPRLADLMSEHVRGPAVDGADAGAAEVDLSDLLGSLAFGLKEARKTVNDHSIAARSDIDWQAKHSTQKLKDQTKAADDTVTTLANKRRDQIDKTVLSHKSGIDWLEKQCRTDAKTYAANAQKAQIEGFASYRLQLTGAFDYWVTHYEKLIKDQSDRLTKGTEKNDLAAWSIAKNYDTRYIQAYGGQSEKRKEVQHDAVYELAADYSTEVAKAKAEFLPELAKIPGQLKVELDKGRDAATVEFDKGLPIVLSGINGQLDAALFDISFKARESQRMLADAAFSMRERVGALEEMAHARNAKLRSKIEGQIEEGRKNAGQQIQRAIPVAMAPITATASEALGMLTDSGEELDPVASELFVDEVVSFSLAAADETGVVFTDARDAGVHTLSGAVPYARRGMVAGKDDLVATLKSEGGENELALMKFNTEAEAYIRSPLVNLDQTFNAAVVEADNRLLEMLNDTRAKLREPMEKTETEIKQSVTDGLSQQVQAKRQLPRIMHNAARQAAWRYDHPYFKHVVDTIEVILGFALVIAMVVGLVVMLPVLVGEVAAAVILTALALLGAFAIGYFGAKAYDERKKAGASGVSAFFGAVADVTGINDVRRAFTDPKMAPFDRGMAWGQFWLSMFGAAAEAPGFLKAIKARLPKRFTNPFRAKVSPGALAAEAEVATAIPHGQPVPEAPKIGFELPHQKIAEPEVPKAPGTGEPNKIGFELPHQKVPEPEVPKVPGASEPKKIGFELPHEKIREPEVPKAPGASEPKKIGFELPHEKVSEPEVPKTPGASQPRKIGFELPHEKIPETVPSAPKEKIGFKGSQEAPAGRVPETKPPMPGETVPASDVIPDMPPAREVPSSQSPGAGAKSSGNQPTRASAGEPPVQGTPQKGSVVSNVEPEVPKPAQTERPLSARDEARLADEKAVQSARERRIADEERVQKLSEEFDEVDKFKKELGKKKERDWVDERFDEKKASLKEAREDLKKSQRAEAEAEAAERVGLRKNKDIDPAAADHDPEFKQRAQNEYNEREARVRENNELINANKEDVARAEAKLAQREKEFEATRPGSDEGPQSRDLARERARARQRVDSAKRHLESVRSRTEAAEAANQNHYKRMQDLEIEINPSENPTLSGEKGDFGENRMHNHMDNEDYDFRGSSKDPASNAKPSDKGLDGAYEKRTPPEPGKPKHVAGEAKYDKSKMAPGQDKAEWVDDRLDKAVGREHANKMRKEGYEYWEMRYNPKSGRVEPKKLWEWRHNGKFGPGQKPLGAPHYFPPT